ncbi:MAG: DUF378 domain-containing protein [Candidatus Shapirobacteria bacterium]|jgi:hypothetical protein
MKNTNTFELILAILLAVGGINWGLVALFNFDLVAALLGVGSTISRIVYILVGISGFYFLLQLFSPRSPTP